MSTWFGVGPVVNGTAALTDRDGRPVGTATFTAEQATGEVTINGVSRAFTADLATGPAGLFRATAGTPGEPGSIEVGWIVLADGTERGSLAEVDIKEPSGPSIIVPAPKKPPVGRELDIPDKLRAPRSSNSRRTPSDRWAR